MARNMGLFELTNIERMADAWRIDDLIKAMKGTDLDSDDQHSSRDQTPQPVS